MYAKIKEGVVENFPYTIQELKEANLNVSFPDNIETDYKTLKEFGVYRIFESSKPSFDTATQKLVESTPKFNEANGRWYRNWELVELSEEEKSYNAKNKADQVRAERDRLLKATDWTQYKDIPEEISSLWAPYRQNLRDITKQEGFPISVNWPQKPVV